MPCWDLDIEIYMKIALANCRKWSKNGRYCQKGNFRNKNSWKICVLTVFFFNRKNCHISVDDSGKTLGISDETKLKMTSMSMSKSTKKCIWLIFENGWKMVENVKSGGVLKNWSFGKVVQKFSKIRIQFLFWFKLIWKF